MQQQTFRRESRLASSLASFAPWFYWAFFFFWAEFLCWSLLNLHSWRLFSEWMLHGSNRGFFALTVIGWSSAGLLFSGNLRLLIETLFGAVKSYVFLGRRVNKGIYVCEASHPQKEIFVPGHFTIQGHGSFHVAYSRIGLLGDRIAHHLGRSDFALGRLFSQEVFGWILLGLGWLGVFAMLESHWLHHGLPEAPELTRSDQGNIGQLIAFLWNRPRSATTGFWFGFIILQLSVLVLLRLKRPKHKDDEAPVFPLPQRVRHGARITARVIDKWTEMRSIRSVTSQTKSKTTYIHRYTFLFAEGFSPPVYLEWSCSGKEHPKAKRLDRAMESGEPVEVTIADVDPEDLPRGGRMPYPIEF